MKKSDLKTGMVLQRREGTFAQVFINTPVGDVYINGDGHVYSFDNYSRFPYYNFSDSENILDVVRVFSPTDRYGFLHLPINNKPPSKYYKIIWEHKESPSIDIIVKINGKESSLSDISEETLLKLRESE